MKKLIFNFICLLLVAQSQARIITVDDNDLADFNNIQATNTDPNVVQIYPIPGDTYCANEIIVKFKEPIAKIVEDQLDMQVSASRLALSPGLDELNARYRAQKLKPLFKNFKKNRQRFNALQQKSPAQLSKKEKHILRRLKRAPKGASVPARLRWICRKDKRLKRCWLPINRTRMWSMPS
jgi:hypothetical protein